jgi:adhesin/invasin
VTVVVSDANGNAISGLSSSAFQFALSGGTSAGTFGSVNETLTKGTYTALFTGTTVGTASTLTSTVNGVTLNSAPTVQVTAGSGVSGTLSTVSFASATVASGQTDQVTIVVQDANGNAVSGLANSAFRFALSGGTSTGTFGAVTETATKGTYTALFTAFKAGTVSTLTTTVGGVTLSTKPTVQVTPGSVSATRSSAGFASSTVALGKTDTLTIVVKDANGNAITGLPGSAFQFALSGGTSAGTFGTVTETATTGTYTVVFTPTTAGTTAAVTITVSGITLASKPKIRVN